MLERVLVGFDGSHHARRACELAIEVAARFGSAVTLVVVRPPKAGGPDPALENLVPVAGESKAFAAMLEEVQSRALSAGATHCDTVYLFGDPLEAILAWVHRHPQDLIVVGSRGLSRGRRLLLGSISSGLVNSAPCPVLVVRGHHGGRPRSSSGSAPSAGEVPSPDGTGFI